MSVLPRLRFSSLLFWWWSRLNRLYFHEGESFFFFSLTPRFFFSFTWETCRKLIVRFFFLNQVRTVEMCHQLFLFSQVCTYELWLNPSLWFFRVWIHAAFGRAMAGWVFFVCPSGVILNLECIIWIQRGGSMVSWTLRQK